VHQHIGFTILYNMDQAGYSPIFAYIVAVATAVALAALINRFVERPGARYLPALWKRVKAGLWHRPESDAQPKPELSANDDPAPDRPFNEAVGQRVP
jgi:peptidoglycan/LPS O-acetylase OafA/YrhL